MEFRTGTEEEVIARLKKATDKNSYPVLKTNGQMLCFVPLNEYAEFIVRTGKRAGEYLEEAHPEVFDRPIEAREILFLLREAYEDDNDYSDETMNKIFETRRALESHTDYINKMKAKYSKDFFENLYPFKN